MGHPAVIPARVLWNDLNVGCHVKELSGGYRRTTNNRMELMAVIAGLEALKKKECGSLFIPTASMSSKRGAGVAEELDRYQFQRREKE